MTRTKPSQPRRWRNGGQTVDPPGGWGLRRTSPHTWVRATSVALVDNPSNSERGCRVWIPGYSGPTGLPASKENPDGVLLSD